MAGYTRLVKDSFEFEGDTVEVVFRRLKRTEYMQLAPFVEMTKSGGADMTFESVNQMYDIIDEIIPAVVKEFKGLVIDGETLIYVSSKEDESHEIFNEIITEAYFSVLIQSLLGSIMNHSMPKNDEASQKKPESTPKGS